MNEHYDNLDGIRAFSCIGIIMMHIKANSNYSIKGFLYNTVIGSLGHLTALFMLISAFSMCCGYYEKVQNKTIDLEFFYSKRIYRIWPFFALFCTIELIIDHTLTSLYEWIADLSLVFGLLPNADIHVVGVGWFLGLIVVFYMLFPFFVFLLGNKKRAWFVFCISVVLNYLCSVYFFDSQHINNSFRANSNIIYSSMFFFSGGLIYLYRKDIIRQKKGYLALAFLISIIAFLFNYLVMESQYFLLIAYSFLLITCISCNTGIIKYLLSNPITHFLNQVSLELYICHMFVFRAIERLNLCHITNIGFLDYIITVSITISCAVIVVLVIKRLSKLISNKK